MQSGQFIQFDSARSNAPFTSFNADSVLGARVFLFKDDVLVSEIYHQAKDANGIFTTKIYRLLFKMLFINSESQRLITQVLKRRKLCRRMYH